MAQGTRKGKARRVSTMFSDETLKLMDGLRCGPDYIEVTCGCTSRRFGDSIGKLRIFTSGQFLITCQCSLGCKETRLTPEEFEKHSLRGGQKKWKRNIWVVVDNVKTQLLKTGLLKYYKHGSNMQNGVCSSRGKLTFHRDEFIRCSRCKKERRFRLRSKEECRIYHDALAKRRWKCSDDMITCEVEEERESRKSCRGCPRSPACKGCTSCVCFGCLRCRFLDCNCRTCVDYMQNVIP